MKLPDLSMIKLAWTERSGAHVGNLVGNVVDSALAPPTKGYSLLGPSSAAGAAIGHHRGSKNKHKSKSALVGGLAAAGGLGVAIGGLALTSMLRTPVGSPAAVAAVYGGKLVGSALGVEAGLGINKLFKKKKK